MEHNRSRDSAKQIREGDRRELAIGQNPPDAHSLHRLYARHRGGGKFPSLVPAPATSSPAVGTGLSSHAPRWPLLMLFLRKPASAA